MELITNCHVYSYIFICCLYKTLKFLTFEDKTMFYCCYQCLVITKVFFPFVTLTIKWHMYRRGLQLLRWCFVSKLANWTQRRDSPVARVLVNSIGCFWRSINAGMHCVYLCGNVLVVLEKEERIHTKTKWAILNK